MIRAIPQGDLDVNDRIACQNAGLHSTLDTVVDSRDPKIPAVGKLMLIRKELSIIVGFAVIPHALKRILLVAGKMVTGKPST